MAKTDSEIDQIIARAASAIATAVRRSITEEVQRATRLVAGAAPPAAAPKPRGRPPGAKSKVAAAATTKPAAKPAPAAPASKSKAKAKPSVAKGGRRSSEQVARDDARLLDYIKSHGGLRSEVIQKGVGLRREDVASGLLRLRAGGKLKMKGEKRSATYTAA